MRESQGSSIQPTALWQAARGAEIQGVLLVAASAVLLAATRPGEGQLAHLVAPCVDALGVVVFVPPLVLGVWGVRRFRHREAWREASELAAWSLLVPVLAAMFEDIRRGAGGGIGYWFHAYLEVLAGPTGARILLAAGFVTSLSHALDLAPTQLPGWIAEALDRGLGAPLRTMAGFLARSFGLMQHLVHLLLRDLWIVVDVLCRRLAGPGRVLPPQPPGPVGPEVSAGEAAFPRALPAVDAPAAAEVARTPRPTPGPEDATPGVEREPPPPPRGAADSDPLGEPHFARAAAVRRSAFRYEPGILPGEAHEPPPGVPPAPPEDDPPPDPEADRRRVDSERFVVTEPGLARGTLDPEADGEETAPEPEPRDPPPEVAAPVSVAPVVPISRPGPEPKGRTSAPRIQARKAEAPRSAGRYLAPSLDLFHGPPSDLPRDDDAELKRKAEVIVTTLRNFGIESSISRITCGPTITQYELVPAAGVKLSKIVGLADDLALALACSRVRMEAPIPGRGAVGIEVPNKHPVPVYFQELLAQDEFKIAKGPLAYVLGKGISGKPMLADLSQAPHLLVAGATGSGKSVCINTLISSLLYRLDPSQVRFVMIDPKMVELMIYDGIPHLVTPVITDPVAASAALKWAVLEMERRYRILSKAGFRSIDTYNRAVEKGEVDVADLELDEPVSAAPHFPYLVIVIDELADLMMVAAKDIEDSICRLAQMARAVGMHLVVATQRPSTNVITGIIKANLPTRIAFRVASRVDSKVILDHIGAEALLGRGDMLYQPVGQPKPLRIQGAFVQEDEIKRLVQHLKDQAEPVYEDIVAQVREEGGEGGPGASADYKDEFLAPSVQLAQEKGEVSTSMLQRHFKIGYNRAACIVEAMEARGLVSGPESGRRRKFIAGPDDVAAALSTEG